MAISLKTRFALEISNSLRKDIKREHPLGTLFWESTLRCNLKCQHCGSDCKVSSIIPDMPFEDFEPVLDSIARKNNPHKVFVIISGGEPLMRGDLEECGRRIYEKGFPWGMVCNGFALTKSRFDRLVDSGMRSISISLDGLEADHDWMRGREGSFQKASSAIKIICDHNASVPDVEKLGFDVITCVNQRNISSLDKIKSHLLGLGVNAWRLFTIVPMGRAKNNPDLLLSGKQLRQVMDFIVKTKEEGQIKCDYACEGFLGNYEGKARDRFFMCDAGITVGSVLIDGSVSACGSIRSDYHQGNIYKEDFMDIWENRFQKYRDHLWMKTGPCAQCKYWRYCEGNGMHLRDENGNLIQCNLLKMQESI